MTSFKTYLSQPLAIKHNQILVFEYFSGVSRSPLLQRYTCQYLSDREFFVLGVRSSKLDFEETSLYQEICRFAFISNTSIQEAYHYLLSVGFSPMLAKKVTYVDDIPF